MILSFLVVILLPLGVATIFSVRFFLNKVYEEALANVQQDIRIASLIYTNKVREMESLCHLASVDGAFIGAIVDRNRAKLSDYLRHLQEQSDVARITVTDEEGTVLVDLPDAEDEGEDLSADTFISRALIGSRPAGSETAVATSGENKGKPFLSITAATPVFDRDGFRQIGAIRFRYPIEKGNKMLNKISGSIKGRVDVYLGETNVASSYLRSEDSGLGSVTLPVETIKKTIAENKAQEAIVIAKNGYLAEFKPITDLDYRPIGVLAINTPSADYYLLRIKSIGSLLLIAVGAIVLGIIIGYWLQKGITTPIIRLTEQTRAVAHGDFSRGFEEIESRDEIGTLSRSFNKMTQDLLLYIEDLKQTTAERERMGKELEIGHQIQQNFLPKTFPDLPNARLFGQSIPATEVGGDFFDVFMLDDRHIGFVMADVSGKGVPAALFMALTRSVLRVIAMEGLPPDEVLSQVNRFISEDNDTCMFVTTFYGILDIETGDVSYSNGGHIPPTLVKHTNGAVEAIPLAKGAALGLIENYPFKLSRIRMEPGDMLFLYTDGIIETPGPGDEEFGTERLNELLSNNRQTALEEIGGRIAEEVRIFSEGRDQFDDLTFLVVRYQ